MRMQIEKEKKNKKISTLKFLMGHIKQYWKVTCLTWLMVLLETACEVFVAYFMQDLINSINNVAASGTVDPKPIYMYAGIIAGFAIVAAITGILAGAFAAKASAGFGKNLREAMFVHIQDFSFKNIDQFSTSSIITRTTTDVSNVQFAFLQIIRATIRAPFLMVFSLIMCFITDWKIAWIFLIIIPLILGSLLLLAKFVHPTFEKVFTTYDKLNEEVQEDVDGIRVVKSFNREDYQKKKFGKVSEFIYKNFIFAEKVMALNSPILNCAVYGAIAAISYFGATQIVASNGTELGVGALSTLITYVMMIMMSLMLISMVFTMIIIARNSAERIKEVLTTESDIVSPKDGLKEVKDGEVIFDHVNFAYVDGKDKDVLHDICAKVESGKTIGILGSTGSSKTTLVSLIARLFDVKSGAVLVSGHNVKDYDLKTLRDAVSVVLQKNTLFSGTIRSNLLWGNEKATDEEIVKACDLAQVTPFLNNLPNGLDTIVEEGGTNLSGGQKQRLTIARALLKKPKILILDDSTSACDTHTDSLIREALREERNDVTKFIISQRILSIKDCDEIWVMDHGKIEARGKNDELMEKSEVYKELYISQLGGGDFDGND